LLLPTKKKGGIISILTQYLVQEHGGQLDSLNESCLSFDLSMDT
jgi:hypothetical protein